MVTRVYRITDECGNSREIIQLIHIKDDVPPTADLLLPIGPFECYGAIPPADISTVTGAADNCSEVTVTFLSDSDDPGCEGKVFRTFRLTDECGNYYDLVQTILVKDTIRPVIKSLPPDLTLDCKAPLPHAKFEDFVAAGGDISDNCGIDLNSFGFIKDTVVSNGCPRIIHRIYLVADYCGNGIRFTQKITITDDEPPALSCPPDVTLTFGEKIPAPYATYASFLTAGGTASDNCEIDESSFTFVTETITRNSQYDLFTRIYRIADWCGNEETCTQVIYRERPVVPTINCPIETELECVGELPAPYTTLLQFIQAGASVSAECPIDTASFRLVFEHSDGKTCPEVISRTYEISDTCGNTVQCVQLWKLDDQTPPQMSCPPEVTVPVGTPVPAVFTTYLQFFGAGGVATDNCGVDESTFLLVSEVVKPGILIDSVYRTYQIADFCGNLATCQHLLYLQKDAETQISCPPMAEPECVGDVPAPLTSFAEYLAAGGSASSKCGIDQASFRLVSETSDGKRCPETITRLYEISDLCGNTVQCKHLIRVTDNNPPQMACPPDTTVKTHDQIPPAFTTFAQFVAGGGMAYDRCKLDESSFVLYREVSDGKSYPETITRTYHIADSCGNFAICEQKIIVKGDAATFINCPNDLGYECFGDVPAPLATYAAFEAAGGSAGSNCGINPASFLLVSENITGNCPRIITRIYEISDNCGNTVRCTQRIIVNDITNPVVTCLPNIEVLPNQSIPAAHFNLAAFRAAGGTATDNCGLREETFTTIDEVNISDPRVINRIYSVLDSCGNRGYCIQTITLITDAETQINCPGTLTVDCINNIPERYKTFAEFRAAGGNASSLCGIDESTFTWIEDKSDGKHCPETISRTYSITDKCGFTAICTQTIVVDDNEKPRFTVWPRVPSTECLIASPYASYAEFTAAGGRITDNCGLDEASFRKTGNDVVDGNSCNRTITRTYQIADLCGNVGIFIQTLTIQDTRPPVMILEPEDISVTCSLNIPKPYANMAEFTTAGGFVTDNCGSVPHIKFIKDEMLAGGCPRIVNRTYHFTDDCGNTLIWVQAITVNDNIPPQIIKKPANINLACITPPPFANYAEFTAAGGEATDNCRIVSFQLVQENWIGVSCPKTLQRTYQVADECGNTDSFTHLITIDDKEAPQMSCPPSLVVEVAAGQTVPSSFTSLAAYLAGGGSVSDNCQVDERTFRMLGERINDYDCERSIIRQYTIADFCGNADTCTHIIYTEKVALPEITCPTDLTVSCISDIPPVMKTFSEFVRNGGSAYDAHGLNESSFVLIREESSSNSCPKVITRTYQISDQCDQSNTCTHRITVLDSIKPQLVCPPLQTIECLSDIPPALNLTDFIGAGGKASDNCAVDIQSFNLISETTQRLPSTIRVTRTYAISDLCLNQATCQQVIELTDKVAPRAVCNNITVSLDANGKYVLSQVDLIRLGQGSTDNCTAPGNLIFDAAPLELSCQDVGNKRRVTLTVTDEAGNSSVCEAEVTILDTIPPVPLCKDITVYLNEKGTVSIQASDIDNGSFDNCKLDRIEINKNKFTCNESGPNVVRLAAIDASGNIATCEAIVTVKDTIAPVAICKPNLLVPMDATGRIVLSPTMVDNGSYDECGIVKMELSQTVFTCEDVGENVITLTVFDPYGNSSTCTSVITIQGNIPPVAVNDTVRTIMNTGNLFNILGNDSDPNGKIDPKTVTIVTPPQHGTVTVNPVTGAVSYTPAPNYLGYDRFTYQVCDDGVYCAVMCDEADVIIRVMMPNSPPVAVDDYFTAGCLPIGGNLAANDTDPDRNRLLINTAPVKGPLHGEITIYPDGTFIYKHENNFVGIDSLVYEICDDGFPSKCDTAKVYIIVLADNDCDGIPDIDDIDDDDDGILDVVEGHGIDPSADHDNDGIPNYLDKDFVGFVDKNFDGVNDNFDSDLDGIPDHLDIDSDNDGIPDNIEGQAEGKYIPPTGKDSNGNGWDDAYDPASGGTPFTPADTDKDGIPDYLDRDSDNDGVPDYIEGHDADANGKPDTKAIGRDKDKDGLDDAFDIYDRSFQPLGTENAIGSNAPLQDFDGDGIRDWRDVDDDEDGIPTRDEDLNNDGDWSNDDRDLDGHPEYLDISTECTLFIPEGFSPNGDGIHDFFQIHCIEMYPNARLYIFNRWGNKLYEKQHYGNLDVWGSDQEAWWWGTSDNKWTLGRPTLPAGTYIYVLELGNGKTHKGTVMISY